MDDIVDIKCPHFDDDTISGVNRVGIQLTPDGKTHLCLCDTCAEVVKAHVLTTVVKAAAHDMFKTNLNMPWAIR